MNTLEQEKQILRDKLAELALNSAYIHYMLSLAAHTDLEYALMETIIRMDAVIKIQVDLLEDLYTRHPHTILIQELLSKSDDSQKPENLGGG